MYIARGEAERILAKFTLGGKPAKVKTYHSPFNRRANRVIEATQELKEQPHSIILVGDLSNPLFFDEFGIFYGCGLPIGDAAVEIRHTFYGFNPKDYEGKNVGDILLSILNNQQHASDYM